MPNETARAAMRRMEFKTVDPVWTFEIASDVFPLTCERYQPFVNGTDAL